MTEVEYHHMVTHLNQLHEARLKVAQSWTLMVDEMKSAAVIGKLNGEEMVRLSLQHTNGMASLFEAIDAVLHDYHDDLVASREIIQDAIDNFENNDELARD